MQSRIKPASLKLRNVTRLRKQFITIDDSTRYRRVTARLHAEGIVLRDEIEGSQIKIKQQQVCKAGDFLVAEIDAKVGGFGVIPPELDGAIVSSHYFLFEIDESKLDKDYLDYFTKTQYFRRQINARGSTNYAAIRPEQVLDIEIPLVSHQEQKSLVAKIKRISKKLDEMEKLRRNVSDGMKILIPSALLEIFSSDEMSKWKKTTVGDGQIAQVIMGQSPPSSTYNEQGIGLPFYQGKSDFGELYPIPKVWCSKPSKIAEPGDILISVRAPIGPVNVCRQESCIGRGLAAIRPTSNVNGFFLFYYLMFYQNRWRGKGSTFKEIKRKDLQDLQVALPTRPEQDRISSYLSTVREKASALKKSQEETDKEIERLRRSIMDESFADLL